MFRPERILYNLDTKLFPVVCLSRQPEVDIQSGHENPHHSHHITSGFRRRESNTHLFGKRSAGQAPFSLTRFILPFAFLSRPLFREHEPLG